MGRQGTQADQMLDAAGDALVSPWEISRIHTGGTEQRREISGRREGTEVGKNTECSQDRGRTYALTETEDAKGVTWR